MESYAFSGLVEARLIYLKITIFHSDRINSLGNCSPFKMHSKHIYLRKKYFFLFRVYCFMIVSVRCEVVGQYKRFEHERRQRRVFVQEPLIVHEPWLCRKPDCAEHRTEGEKADSILAMSLWLWTYYGAKWLWKIAVCQLSCSDYFIRKMNISTTESHKTHCTIIFELWRVPYICVI